MISKQDILQMARSVTRKSNGRVEHTVIHPRREWLIGLGVFILIMIGTGILNAQHFIHYDTIDDEIVPKEIPVKTYNIKTADQAVRIFEDRKQIFIGLIQKQAAVIMVPEETASSTPAETEIDDVDVEEVTPQPTTSTRPTAS